jgi:hypothetical protein
MGAPTDLHNIMMNGVAVPVDDQDLKVVASDVECAVCGAVICWRPMIVCRNMHIFCESCIVEWQRQSNKCPTCKEIMDLQPLKIKNPLMWRVVSKIQIYCPYNKNKGCSWKGQYSDALDTHHRLCEHFTTQCTQCLDMVQTRKLEKHKKEECKKLIECPLKNLIGCNQKILAAQFAEHAKHAGDSHIAALAAFYMSTHKTL